MTMISKIVTTTQRGVVEQDFVPSVNSISRRAYDVLTKVYALREYTGSTGFKTTKSQNDLIQSLNGEELASVLLILKYHQKLPSLI